MEASPIYRGFLFNATFDYRWVFPSGWPWLTWHCPGTGQANDIHAEAAQFVLWPGWVVRWEMRWDAAGTSCARMFYSHLYDALLHQDFSKSMQDWGRENTMVFIISSSYIYIIYIGISKLYPSQNNITILPPYYHHKVLGLCYNVALLVS